MRSIESSGKSIDEAIFNGLKELEISIVEVDIEIVQSESKGLFGIGSKPAIVRLIEREEELYIPETSDRKPQERKPHLRGGDNRRREGRTDGRRNDAPRQPRERHESYEEEAVPEKVIPYTPEEAETNPAAIFLAGLIKAMGIEAAILAYTDEDGIFLRIDSEAMGMLIGHRGETLDAIQYLTSLVINSGRKDEKYTRVTIDTEGYRRKREETLQRLARKIASQVKRSGRSRALEPMNPYERRVLHSSLQSNPYVETHSEGEEPNRRVVVTLKK